MMHRKLKRRFSLHAILVVALATGIAGCGENAVSSAPAVRRDPAPLGWELAPLQQRLLVSPVSPVAAGRPASRADLEEARNWFGPGEREAILAVVNRGARARGADTLPHCVPLCHPAASASKPGVP